MAHKKRFYFCVLVSQLIAWNLFGCTLSSHANTPSTTIAAVTKTKTLATPILSSTILSSHTSTATQTSTPTSSPTSTPQPILYSVLQSSSIDNANQLTRLGEWDQGLSVKQLTFSSDGKFLLVGCADENTEAYVNIWGVQSASLLTTIKTKTRFLSNFSISNDGKELAIANYGNNIELWNIETKNIIPFSGEHEYLGVKSVAFSPNGKFVAIGYFSEGVLRIWNLETDQLIYDIQADTHEVNAISFTGDGQRVVTGGYDGTVKVWKTYTGRLSFDFDVTSEPKTDSDISYVVAYTISQIVVNDNKGFIALAGCGDKCAVQIRDVTTGSLINQVSEQVVPTAIAFSPDGSILAIGRCLKSDKQNRACTSTISLFDSTTMQVIKEIENMGSVFAISPDGKVLAIGDELGRVYLFGITNP